MPWFSKRKYSTLTSPVIRDRIPQGLCTKCLKCQAILLTRDLDENMNVCPKCAHHMKVPARQRITQIVDKDTFVETHANMTSADPLGFRDIRSYPEQIARYQKSTGLVEAVLTGHGKIYGLDVSLAFMDPFFIAASMGSVVGEKITRTFELSLERDIPAVIFCTAGGARMQEGILSLMQMAKTSGLVGKLRERGVPYIAVLTDPTGAGVAASFASLGDLIISEPDAMVYFAGPRVIEQTIRQVLPRGFQRAEFVQKHGFIDMIVARKDMKRRLAELLALLTRQVHAPFEHEEA